MEKDYSLLRPFDLEAAKRGDRVQCTYSVCSGVGTLIAVFRDGKDFAFNIEGYGLVVVVVGGNEHIAELSKFKMAPLTWIEGKPVYPGDELYYKEGDFGISVTGYNRRTGDTTGLEGAILAGTKRHVTGEVSWAPFDCWTWQKPKIKLEGWVNVYPPLCFGSALAHLAGPYETEGLANELAGDHRLACVRIEWEE